MNAAMVFIKENLSFNTVNGKHCCNYMTIVGYNVTGAIEEFQYRKR